MTRPKTERSPAQTFKILDTYVTALGSDTSTQLIPTVGDLLGARVDRVRLWKGGRDHPVKVRDIALLKPAQPVKGDPVYEGDWLDPDLLQIVDEIEDPEIALDLTMDMESGVVSLAVEMEPVLVGQDLSMLAKAGATDEFPTFDDEPFDESYWSADEAATALNVAKTTITRRIKKNELIGFRLFKNALYVPKEQMAGQVPIKGLAEVLALFENEHYEAWKFLTAPVFYGEANARPIDRLKAIKTEEAMKSCLAELETAKAGFDYGDHM